MKILAVLLMILTLFGCAEPETVLSEELSSAEEVFLPEELTDEETEEPEQEITEVTFTPPKRSSPRAAVKQYFSALYDSYIDMIPVDISPVIDLDYAMMRNVMNWNSLLAMRRRLIAENGYCYVETERFDYEIEFIEESDLDDRRMYYIDLSDYGENAAALHFVIKGDEGKAYPPIFALNSQHTVVITEENGQYRIAYHYFPGSEGKFENDLPVELMTEAEMSEILEKEFAFAGGPAQEEPKYGRLYDAEAAVQYALQYCEEQNPDFYFVGDWYGNCMNFTSQCVWAGFRAEGETAKNFDCMTYDWYCFKNGGSLIWTSVSRFWSWRESRSCRMQTVAFYGIRNAKAGDIVNIGSFVCAEEEKYTHALVLVDEEKLILAQNSPANFIYYSDLVNNYARFIRPVSLKA